MVKITLIEGANVSVECEFIAGSDATGCMVVLIGLVAYPINLTRNPNKTLTTLMVTLELSPFCYTGVEAFDIESDGSVGSLAVHGQLGDGLETLCYSTESPIQTSPSKIPIIIIIIKL